MNTELTNKFWEQNINKDVQGVILKFLLPSIEYVKERQLHVKELSTSKIVFDGENDTKKENFNIVDNFKEINIKLFEERLKIEIGQDDVINKHLEET